MRTVPDTISVAGSAEGLESLADNNNVITIPEDSIDISGESEDVEEKNQSYESSAGQCETYQ